jgi:O-antigen ligase
LKKLTTFFHHQSIAQLAMILLVLGLFAGKAVMSMATLLFFCNALFNKNVIDNLKTCWTTPTYKATIVVFLIYIVSITWSSQYHNALSIVVLHLPFVAFAIGFSAIKLSKTFFIFLMRLMILCVTVAITVILIKYIQNMSEVHKGYKYSHGMWVPFKNDHIRFSMIVSLTAWMSWYLIKWDAKYKLLYKMSLIGCIFFLHVLAAKTGVLTCYILLIMVAIQYFKQQQNKLWSIVSLLILVGLPFLFYTFSYTFKEKVNYTIYAFKQPESNGSITFYSDRGRLISYKLSSKIIKENILLGIGSCDATRVMDNAFKEQFGASNYKLLLPHNQLLMMILIAGVFGLLAIIYFWWATWQPVKHRNVFFVGCSIIFLIPFMVEPLWEIQYGITIHIFFLLLLTNFLEHNRIEDL